MCAGVLVFSSVVACLFRRVFDRLFFFLVCLRVRLRVCLSMFACDCLIMDSYVGWFIWFV